eukprot:2124911-Prymnesium_polylepis.2
MERTIEAHLVVELSDMAHLSSNVRHIYGFTLYVACTAGGKTLGGVRHVREDHTDRACHGSLAISGTSHTQLLLPVPPRSMHTAAPKPAKAPKRTRRRPSSQHGAATRNNSPQQPAWVGAATLPRTARWHALDAASRRPARSADELALGHPLDLVPTLLDRDERHAGDLS